MCSFIVSSTFIQRNMPLDLLMLLAPVHCHQRKFDNWNRAPNFYVVEFEYIYDIDVCELCTTGHVLFTLIVQYPF